MAKYRLFIYPKGPLKGNKEPGIYEDAAGRKYIRPRLTNGQRPYLSLGTKSISEAIKMRDSRKAAKSAAKIGIAIEPEAAAQKASVSVAKVIHRYQADGYPGKKGVLRNPGRHLAEEVRYTKTLLNYFNTESSAADLVQNDLDEYKDWRVARIKANDRKRLESKGEQYIDSKAQRGLRTVDLELNCLNNAMRWAVRKNLLKSNPIASRARYHTITDAIHCREFAAANCTELHHIAGSLMASRRSETLGWQLLYEGMTGLRSEETVRLRIDARPDEPGGITEDGQSLCVRRAQKSKKQNSYVLIHKGLKRVMQAHRIWHAQRYPLSPWYFPGRDKRSQKHIDKDVLTKALGRLYKIFVDFRDQEPDPKKFPSVPHLTKKYTSHGAGRAFYVLVRRSHGISDAQIAFELNQTGGVGTLEQVYGLPPEHWKDGRSPKLSWLPSKEYFAWKQIKKIKHHA